VLNVALTGNVAAGKSAVARRWADAGVPVVSADDLARQAVAPGSEGLAAVVEALGDGVLASDGSLDRARVRALVFGDAAARARLEGIVHPVVWRLRARWVDERRAEGAALAVSEIPLLFETGREGDFDVVVVVDAPESVRLDRIVANRGLDPDEARRIVDAQMAASEKRTRADFVVENAGDLAALEREADRVLRALRLRAEVRPRPGVGDAG
jgi:dephospho-CoA kinase